MQEVVIQGVIAALLLAPLLSLAQKRLGLTATLAAIAAVIAIKLTADSRTLIENGSCYSILGVHRFSGPLEIRQAYKKVSLKNHPDKNPTKEAEATFQAVKKAYDTLMGEKERDIYNRFGRDAAFSSSDPRSDELKLIADIFIVYLLWGLAIYGATLSPGSRICRTWMAIVLLVILVIEVSLSLTETELPAWMPFHCTEFQLITALHCAVPCLLLLLQALAEHLYVDMNAVTMEVLSQQLARQSLLRDLLSQLESVAGPSAASSCDLDEVQSKVAEIRTLMVNSEEQTLHVVERLKNSSSTPGSSYYWLIFVAIYGGVYFFQD